MNKTILAPNVSVTPNAKGKALGKRDVVYILPDRNPVPELRLGFVHKVRRGPEHLKAVVHSGSRPLV